MKTINLGLLGAIVTISIFNISHSASAYSIVFGERGTTSTRTDFINSLDVNSSSTVIDDGTNFGAAPTPVGSPGVDSITRSGNIGTDSFTYTIYDIDFSDTPNGSINPGIVGDDIDDLDKLLIETPAVQETAEGIYAWGVDGDSGSFTNNAALFDFTGNSIGHFGVDLHDFEAGEGIDISNITSGASGEIRLYQSGTLVHSYTLQFPGVDGGGSTDNPSNTTANDSSYQGYGNKQSMFVGISADNPSEFFDQAVFVLGDDDVDIPGIASNINDGSTEKWAADGFTFGYAYQAEVPFDFSPTLGLFCVSGFWLLNRILKNKSANH